MKFLDFCADTDVGVAVGSIGSEEKAGIPWGAIRCFTHARFEESSPAKVGMKC
jgi:hypothetical protein